MAVCRAEWPLIICGRDVDMRPRLLTACALALGLAPPGATSAAAEEVGLGVTGVVTSSNSVYDYSGPPLQSDISARLVYLTDSEQINNLGSCDCGSYRQQIFNGFSATFGDFAVRADEYYIEVINDFAPDGGADLLKIVFASDYIPANETPLYVNGAAEESGELYILLRNVDGTAIDDSSLPDPATFGAFEKRYIFLSESPTQFIADLGGILDPPTPLDLVFGDYDFDDDVDGSDFLSWQRSVGAMGISPADGDRNGSVDAGDLAVWEQHFGEAAGDSRPSSAPVPEPSGASIAALLLTFGIIGRSRVRGAKRR